MSNSGIPIIEDIGKGVKKLFRPDMPGPHVKELPERSGPADPEIAKRVTEQFPLREQAVRQRALAAGVTRSDNEADLLGASAPKRRSARRTCGATCSRSPSTTSPRGSTRA